MSKILHKLKTLLFPKNISYVIEIFLVAVIISLYSIIYIYFPIDYFIPTYWAGLYFTPIIDFFIYFIMLILICFISNKFFNESNYKKTLTQVIGPLYGAISFLISLISFYILNVTSIMNLILNSLSVLFLGILGIYIGHQRIPRAKKFFGSAERLSSHLDRPEFILGDFGEFIDGIEGWCAESWRIRIENHETIKRNGASLLITDKNDSKKKFLAVIKEVWFHYWIFLFFLNTCPFFVKTKHVQGQVLLRLLKKLREDFLEISFVFVSESFFYNLKREMGKLGLIITTSGYIGAIIDYILKFI